MSTGLYPGLTLPEEAVDTDGTDGSGGGDDTMAIVLERIAAICASYKLPLQEVAETFAGYAEFLATEAAQDVAEAPPRTASGAGKPTLTVIRGGKS